MNIINGIVSTFCVDKNELGENSDMHLVNQIHTHDVQHFIHYNN